MEKIPQLSFEKHIYDSIHGYIGITRQELAVINNPIFQRLHNIRHLGTAFLVYPGATHTRFAHSLGTMFVMNKVAEKLATLGHISSEEEIQILRMAALLHDIGHFPFSHALEIPIMKRSSDGKKTHESFSEHLIRNSKLKDAFETIKPEEVASIIAKKYTGNNYYSLLISSDLDVDRFDYLLRDSHETGVSYGNFDVDRLIQTMLINEDEEFLAVEDKGRQSLEQFLMARYHMYQTVYYHKTNIGFRLLLEKIYDMLMEEGIAHNYDDLLKLSLEDTFNFNDHYVWNLMNNPDIKGILKELIMRFKYRNRIKMIKEITAISIARLKTPEYSKLELINSPSHLDRLIEASDMPKEWAFFFNPKPLEILSDPDGERAIRIQKEDGTYTPIAKEEKSVISMLYQGGYLASRVYTKDEYEENLLSGLSEYLDI